jgi:hypothetical protein
MMIRDVPALPRKAGALGDLQQFDAISSAASRFAVPFLLDEDGHDNERVPYCVRLRIC